MRSRRTISLRAFAAAAAFASAIVASELAPASGAPVSPSVTPIPYGFTKMVVDPASNHVFVSAQASSTVTALDFDGTIVASTGVAGAAGLALDGAYLFVAGTGEIVELSTSTLATVATYPESIESGSDLVLADGELWSASSHGGLMKIDPGDGTATTYSSIWTTTGLIANPVSPTLYTWDVGDSPLTIEAISVDSTPTVSTPTVFEGSPDISNVQDIAISPDGSTLIPAGGYPYQFDSLSATTLEVTNPIYPAFTYPSAVATTSAHGGMLAGGLAGWYNADVLVYHLGDTNASDELLSYQFPGFPSDWTLPGGVAFSPNGNQLFVVSDDINGDGVTSTSDDLFHVFQLYPLPAATTTTTLPAPPATTLPAPPATTLPAPPATTLPAPPATTLPAPFSKAVRVNDIGITGKRTAVSILVDRAPAHTDLGSNATYELTLTSGSTRSPTGTVTAMGTTATVQRGALTRDQVLGKVKVHGNHFSVSFNTRRLGIGHHVVKLSYSGSPDFSPTSTSRVLAVVQP